MRARVGETLWARRQRREIEVAIETTCLCSKPHSPAGMPHGAFRASCAFRSGFAALRLRLGLSVFSAAL